MIKIYYIIILSIFIMGQSDYKIESDYNLIIKEYLSNVYDAQDSIEKFHLCKYKLLGMISQPVEVYLFKNNLNENKKTLLVVSESGFGWVNLHSIKIMKNNLDGINFLNFKDIFIGDSVILKESKRRNQLIKQFSVIDETIIFEEMFKTKNDFIVFKHNGLYYVGHIDNNSNVSNNFLYDIINNGETVRKEY